MNNRNNGRKNYLLYLLCGLGFVAASVTAGAQAYKWIDKDGKVQYTATPPEPGQSKGEAKAIRLPTPGPSAPAVAPKDPLKEAVRAKANAEVQTQKAAKEEVDQKNAKINEENCRNAKSALATLDTGAPLRKSNEKGELEIMDDAQRAAEQARAQEVIVQACK